MLNMAIGVLLAIVGLAVLVMRIRPRIIGPALLAAAAIAALSGAVVIIPAGHVGVPVLFGKVRGYSISEGLHLVNPLLEVVKMSVRTEVYTMSVATREGQRLGDDSIVVLSADGMEMPLDITVAYRLIGRDAPLVFRNIGERFEEKIIRPAARTAIREAASRLTALEAYSTKREELAKVAQGLLVERIRSLLGQHEGFAGEGFEIQEVMLRNVALPARVRAAIEEKLAAEQDAQRMQFVLAKEEKEAERKGIEASGIAEFQKVVSEGISDKLLQWKGIEATMEIAKSPNAKVVIIGSGEGGLPVILNTPEDR